MKYYLIFLAAFLLLLLSCKVSAQKIPRKITLPAILEEVSGIYYVSPDSIWCHNDSGDQPLLYLTNFKGELRSTVSISGGKHIDWEDLTYDDEGWLYIADFGNNRNKRTQLVIYKFHPATQQLDSIPFSYEDQANKALSFNAEALLYHQDSLYIFTKSRLPKSDFTTRLYSLSTEAKPQIAFLQGNLTLKKRVVTAAAIHKPTGTIALLAYYYKKVLGFLPISKASIFYLTDYPDNHFFDGQITRKKVAGFLSTQYEAIDYVDEQYILVGSEKTAHIKARLKRKKWGKRNPQN